MASILCIDDNPQLLQVHKALLESQGYTVLTAADGATGIAVTRTHSLDLVILDFHMPGLNGGQVAEVLKKEQPRLQLAICTGCPDEIPEQLKEIADKIVSKLDGPVSFLCIVRKLVDELTNSEDRSTFRAKTERKSRTPVRMRSTAPRKPKGGLYGAPS